MKSTCEISDFKERDIDLFLAEELRVNSDFSRWFVAQGGGGFECAHPAISTKKSVYEEGHEADIAALYQDDLGRQFRLFVENKLTASKMPEQLERYVGRARSEEARGETAGWAIKLFSPDAYGDKHCPDGVQSITFEEAAEFLRCSSTDPRITYKADFLSKAAVLLSGSERDAHIADSKPHIKEFWDAVDERIEERFPGYFSPRKTRYPTEPWIALGAYGFTSKLVWIDFKGQLGVVDLAFRNCKPEKLARVLKDIPDVPGKIPPNLSSTSKSTPLRISGLQRFKVADGPSVIEERVIPAYEAAHRLIEFWKKHEEKILEALDE